MFLNVITKTETKNATNIPVINVNISTDENAKPNFNIFTALNPNITGTAKKKVNSAAATLDTPISNAPTIVEPERDVPGIIDNT